MQSINPLEMASLHIVYDNMCPLEEKAGRRGIFHFIEHMIGVLLDPILPKLHEFGITDDLFTNHEHVVLSFTGTAEALEKFAPKIVSTIAKAKSNQITHRMFVMERDAIFNEMRELEADFYAATLRNALSKVYGIHAPEGCIEDVSGYTFNQFKKDFDELVPHPTNICYVGPRSIDLPDLRKEPYKIGKYPKFAFKATKKSDSSDVDTDRDSVVITAFSTKPITNNKDYAAINMACHMLGGDNEGAMYKELRVKKHLVYSCDASVEPFRTAAIPIFYTGTSGTDCFTVIEAMRGIFAHPEKYLSKRKFERCKHTFESVLKQHNIMLFTAPGSLTRYGMISDEPEISNITYEYMMGAVKKYITPDNFRFFAG